MRAMSDSLLPLRETVGGGAARMRGAGEAGIWNALQRRFYSSCPLLRTGRPSTVSLPEPPSPSREEGEVCA